MHERDALVLSIAAFLISSPAVRAQQPSGMETFQGMLAAQIRSQGFTCEKPLALQLHFPFEVSATSVGLVGSPPERPCEDAVDRDAPLSELDSDAPDFLNRPTNQERCLVRRRGGVFLSAGSALARWRMTVIMAKASMTSETWRCQPCQERVSL